MICNLDSNINNKEIIKIIDDIQDMCNNVLILYKAYGKKNQELSDLANLAYNLLWIYSKSLIVLKMLLNSSVRCEQDYALGQICVTVNEGIKAVIGFTPDKRNTSLWIGQMGKYILEQVELKSQYDKITNDLIRCADTIDHERQMKTIRDLATHGNSNIEELLKLHMVSNSEVFSYLDKWSRCLWPAANFAYVCFERECQQEKNNK